MHDSTRYLWQYWETTRAVPPYLQLCLETVERNSTAFERVIVNEKSAYEWLPGLGRTWERLAAPAHRADYVRARLLESYGGLWLDVDVVALYDLTQLSDLADRADIVAWVNIDGAVAINLVCAPKQSPVIGLWAEAQDRLLAHSEGQAGESIQVAWNALGSDLLTPLARGREGASVFIDPKRVAPISWREADRLLAPASKLKALFAPGPYAVMLYNAILEPQIGDLSAADLLNSDVLLAALLRVGVGPLDGRRGDPS